MGYVPRTSGIIYAAAPQTAARRAWNRVWPRYGVAVIAVGTAILLKQMTASWIERESPFLLFFAAVMVSAWQGGAGPGLLATLLAALASDFYFTPPFYSIGEFSRPQAVRFIQFLLEGGVISLLGGALHRARARAEAASTEAESARSQLQHAYEKQSRVVETLQRSLLLSVPAGRFEGVDVASLYEAALDEAEVGGDLFDAVEMPDGQVALVVGDVAGKGLGAAAHTAEAKFALRAFLFEETAPERVLARLNRFLCDRAGHRRENASDNRFIVLILAVLDPRSGTVRFGVAGAEPPLVVRQADAIPCLVTEARGLPLGIHDGATYTPALLTLAPGDTLLLFTDGLTEARPPGTRGVYLEYEGLVDLAQTACRATGESADVTARRILEAVKRFSGGALRDDACLIVARRDLTDPAGRPGGRAGSVPRAPGA